MDRSELINQICTTINNTKDNKVVSDLKVLLSDLISNKDTLDNVEDRYNTLVNDNKTTTDDSNNDSSNDSWVKQLVNKNVYKSLLRFQDNKLSYLDTCKMISSLITHSVIELGKGDSTHNLRELNIELSKVLTKLFITNSLNSKIRSNILEIFDKYKVS